MARKRDKPLFFHCISDQYRAGKGNALPRQSGLNDVMLLVKPPYRAVRALILALVLRDKRVPGDGGQ